MDRRRGGRRRLANAGAIYLFYSMVSVVSGFHMVAQSTAGAQKARGQRVAWGGDRGPSSRDAQSRTALMMSAGAARAAAGAVDVAVGDPPSTATATATSSSVSSFSEFGKMPWKPEGYESWQWDGHKINYAVTGQEGKPAILLVHGFGASAFHWRYNMPALAQAGYRVYAMDLLGFGLSDKPLVEYTADVWRDQAVAFINEVVQEPVVIAGNSLGGYTALAAASELTDKVKGCVLINAAGRFDNPEADAEAAALAETGTGRIAMLANIKEWATKTAIKASFYYTKQPLRIKQVLRQVYSVNPDNVDDELVESIRLPAENPDAPEVFFRVIRRSGKLLATFNDLLKPMTETPILLLWGQKDPWIQPITADKIEQIHPQRLTTRVKLDAGHCPHDEDPEECNSAFVDWMKKIRYA